MTRLSTWHVGLAVRVVLGVNLLPSFSGRQTDQALLAAAGILGRVGLEVGLEEIQSVIGHTATYLAVLMRVELPVSTHFITLFGICLKLDATI